MSLHSLCIKSMRCHLQGRIHLINRRFSRQHMPCIVSALQPTGVPHLGNYLGALEHWKDLQFDSDKVFFGIADNHTYTVPVSPGEVRKNIMTQTAFLLAIGLSPSHCTIFQHSSVPYHTSLAWLLSTVAHAGELRKLPQYQEKSLQMDSIALLSYPILMSADILLYHGSHVPVGNDQLDHIRICNNTAKRFNKQFNRQIFQPVLPLLTKAPRVKSLSAPNKKMSKSSGKQIGLLSMLDTDETIRKKVKKAVTDSYGPITVDKNRRLAVHNLLSLYSSLTKTNFKEVSDKYEGGNVAGLKTDLADIAIEVIGPIRDKTLDLLKDKKYLRNVLDDGGRRANIIARKTMEKIYHVVGMR